MSERKCHILKDPEGCGCKCIDSLRARVAELEAVLRRCQTILGNMAAENEGGYFTPRWQINHEPLRNDAKNLLPDINAVLAKWSAA